MKNLDQMNIRVSEPWLAALDRVRLAGVKTLPNGTIDIPSRAEMVRRLVLERDQEAVQRAASKHKKAARSSASARAA